MTDGTGYQSLRQGSLGQRLKFLLRDSALYGGSSIISRLFSLFTLPVLARIFSTAEFGIVDVITVIGNVLMAFVTMGQDSAVARFYYEQEDERERREIVTQGLLLEAFPCLVLCVITFASAASLLETFTGSAEHAGVLRILIASIPFVILLNFTRNLMKWTFARRQYIILEVGSAAVVVTLTLLFVPGLGMGVEGVFYAQLLGMGLLSLLGTWFCRAFFVLPRRLRQGPRMFHFGWPYMVLAVGGTLIPALDRGFITRFLDLDAMGFYALGYKYAFLLMLPVMAFQTAWGPFSLSLYRERDAEETYNRVFTLFTVGACLLAYALVAAKEPAIVILASDRYLPGSVVVLPLAFSLVAQSAAWITGLGIGLSKKTYYSLASYAAGLAATALAIRLLVRPYGIAGAATGVLIGQVVQAIVYTAFAYRVYPLRFTLKTPLLTIGLSFVLCLLVEAAPLGSISAHILFRTLLFALFCTALWRLVLTPQERTALLALLLAKK